MALPQPPEPSRDLLFGLLARQSGLIDQAGFSAAFENWLEDRTQSMAEVLAGLGSLDGEQIILIAGLVAQQLKMHGGDATGALGTLDVGESTFETLARIEDSQVQATLAPVRSSQPGAGGRAVALLARAALSESGKVVRHATTREPGPTGVSHRGPVGFVSLPGSRPFASALNCSVSHRGRWLRFVAGGGLYAFVVMVFMRLYAEGVSQQSPGSRSAPRVENEPKAWGCRTASRFRPRLLKIRGYTIKPTSAHSHRAE